MQNTFQEAGSDSLSPAEKLPILMQSSVFNISKLKLVSKIESFQEKNVTILHIFFHSIPPQLEHIASVLSCLNNESTSLIMMISDVVSGKLILHLQPKRALLN